MRSDCAPALLLINPKKNFGTKLFIRPTNFAHCASIPAQTWVEWGYRLVYDNYIGILYYSCGSQRILPRLKPLMHFLCLCSTITTHLLWEINLYKGGWCTTLELIPGNAR
jgi:hypothetical protein